MPMISGKEVNPDDFERILAARAKPKTPQPTQKQTDVIRTIVITKRKNDGRCAYGTKYSTDERVCANYSPYRVWGLAYCEEHLYDRIQQELDRE